MTMSCGILHRMRNVSDKSCRENLNIHFMFCNFLWKSYRLRDKVGKYSTATQAADDNKIRCMCFPCLKTKATITHTHTRTLRIRNAYCFCTAAIDAWKRLKGTFQRTLLVLFNPLLLALGSRTEHPLRLITSVCTQLINVRLVEILINIPCVFHEVLWWWLSNGRHTLQPRNK